MKTKLFLCVLAFGLMSSTCSTEEQSIPDNICNCKKVYYDYGVISMNGPIPTWGYVKVGEEPAVLMECNLDTGEYVQIDSNSYYKIYCE